MVSSIFTTACNVYTASKNSTDIVKKMEDDFVSIFTEANFSKKVSEFIDDQIESINPFSSAGNMVASAIPGGIAFNKLTGGLITNMVNGFLDQTGLSKYTNQIFNPLKAASHGMSQEVGNACGTISSSIGKGISEACSQIGSAIKSFTESISTPKSQTA